MTVSQKTLDFGLVSAGEPSDGHGIAKLTITNEGERILVGRIAIQVAWTTVYPPDFRLNPGESSEHIFTVRHNTQISWSTHRMGSDFIALINSNGGSETIGGYYFSDPNIREMPAKKPIRRWLVLTIPVLLILTAVLIFWISNQNNEVAAQQKTAGSEQFYTEIARTYFADIDQNIGDSSADAADTPESLTAAMDETAPETPVPSLTFTPWVVADYPNVEDFIRSYYLNLDEQNYETAWWMLSEKEQQACCYTGEDTPMTVYTNFWDTVDSVDVNYAYLQENNVNPAEVNVSLTYHYVDGTTEDVENRFSIITDEMKNSLMIDEIR